MATAPEHENDRKSPFEDHKICLKTLDIPHSYYFSLRVNIFWFALLKCSWVIPVTSRTVQKILFYAFPAMKLRDLVPNSYIHVSVSDLYIPRISLPFWLQQKRQTDPGNIPIAHRYMYESGNWKTEHFNSVLKIKRSRSFISGNT